MALLAALLGQACSSDAFRASADAEVAEILDSRTEAVLGDRAETVIYPESRPAPAETEPPEPEAAPGEAPPSEIRPGGSTAAAPTFFDLRGALGQAVRTNRDYLSRKESLYQQGLSYSLTRFNFGPLFNAALGYLWTDQKGGSPDQSITANVSGSQILPTGGRLSVNAALSAGFFDPDPETAFASSAGVSLTQPLLRGAGYEVSHEALTQAERNLVYAVRDFELFRENFSIEIARAFFQLVSQRKTLANEEERYREAVFDREKAEALRQVDRNDDQEVFRTRRREIETHDSLIDARASYDRAVDEFKIRLGLPTEIEIELADIEPPFESVNVDEASAVRAARHNRLDIMTERNQLEDAERAVRISENQLLPSFDLTAGYGVSETSARFGSSLFPDDFSASAGLSFEIPLQRKAERNAYRSSLIALDQARRNLELRLDQLDLDVRDQLRRLRSVELRIRLQEQQIEQERRAVAVNEIRYLAGELDNRDLLEARQALVDAQNALIRLKVDHFIGRLSLLRDLGILFIDSEGMWRS